MKDSTENYGPQLAQEWNADRDAVLCLHTEDRARLPRMLKMQDFTTLHEGEFTAGVTGSTRADSDRCAAMRIEVLIYAAIGRRMLLLSGAYTFAPSASTVR